MEEKLTQSLETYLLAIDELLKNKEKVIVKNVAEYFALKELIQSEWKDKHHTALAFAPDHGCHRWLGLLGNHGINEPCDMNTIHFWTLF